MGRRTPGRMLPRATAGFALALAMSVLAACGSNGGGDSSTVVSPTSPSGPTTTRAATPQAGRTRLTFRAVMQQLPPGGNPPTTPPREVSRSADVVLASTDPSGAVVARYELGPVLLDGSIVQHAEAVQSQATQQWQVNFTMTPSGSKSFDAMASGHYHQMIAMVVDDNVISAPEINAVRFHGAGQISGALTETGARQLADILNTPG